METIYRLPTWAETTLVICVAVMMAGLAAWIACKAISEAINAEARLQHKKSYSETKALSKWQKLYEDEHQQRADDNAKLIAEIIELQCENKRMKMIMEKVRLGDL